MDSSRGAAGVVGITIAGADAAKWATAGFMPGEAEPFIRDGVTPETADKLNRLATDIAGGPEQRSVQRIDELVADGVLVDPALVRWDEDSSDPTHIIVHVLPTKAGGSDR